MEGFGSCCLDHRSSTLARAATMYTRPSPSSLHGSSTQSENRGVKGWLRSGPLRPLVLFHLVTPLCAADTNTVPAGASRFGDPRSRPPARNSRHIAGTVASSGTSCAAGPSARSPANTEASGAPTGHSDHTRLVSSTSSAPPMSQLMPNGTLGCAPSGCISVRRYVVAKVGPSTLICSSPTPSPAHMPCSRRAATSPRIARRCRLASADTAPVNVVISRYGCTRSVIASAMRMLRGTWPSPVPEGTRMAASVPMCDANGRLSSDVSTRMLNARSMSLVYVVRDAG
mmetsp:Transcript_832/g.2557  ORF Transcript_832/g.2557 Transcript_832/m.2557 type:complete len:285 (+) Transcript_832:745-1599(+)